MLPTPYRPLALIAAATLFPACASAGLDAGVDGRDGGVYAADGARGSDGAPTASLDAGSMPPAYEASSDRGCYDLLDGDSDGRVDCSDDECSVTPLCCVGSSEAACCAAQDDVAIDFADCAGEPVESCGPELVVFGAPAPYLMEGGLVPNGDRFDSGVYVSRTFDPRALRVVLRATIALGDPCDGCTDHLAFGLDSGERALGPSVDVTPDVALVISKSHRELRLAIGSAVVAAAPLDSMVATLGIAYSDPFDVELEVRPDGVLGVHARTATATATPFSEERFAPLGPSRVVIFGRTSNRTSGDPAPVRVNALRVTARHCDVPAAASRSDSAILPDAIDPWWPSDARVEGASTVAYTEGDEVRRRMAFSSQGRVHLAGAISEGRFRALADPSLPENAILVPGGAPWIASVLEPELAVSGDRLVLYFTAVGDDGSTSIGRALGAAGFGAAFGAPEQILSPDPEAGVLGWDGPDFYQASFTGTARPFLAVRKHGASGTALVVLDVTDEGLSEADGTFVDRAAGDAVVTSHEIHRASHDDRTFDADEVASPAMVQYRDVLRMYFAGRRGTRWSIGMLLSQDGTHWRLAELGAPILSGSGSGFDALSVRDPEPVLVDRELLLYYTGTDGVTSSIGLARSEIPIGSAP